MGQLYGAEIRGATFPIPYREIDIRRLEPGDKIDFLTTREGNAEIILPEPCIGCERKR